MIENCCKNCAHYYILDYLDNQKYCEFQDCEIKHECSTCFQPKEELVRQDERDKMIEKIKKFYHSARNEKFSNSMNFLELLLYLDNEEKEN